VFEKYEIDMFGNIYNKKSKRRLSYTILNDYYVASVYDHVGKRCCIYVARAVVSTFHGKPPTEEHSTEHIDCTNKKNNIVCELTWIDPSGQLKNQIRPEDLLSAYIIVRDNMEMTNKEWATYMKNEKNHLGHKYTEGMIRQYAKKKQHGFSYKVYENLPDETWYHIVNSKSSKGHWEISDQNRIARVTKHARNVIDVARFGFMGKYPKININEKQRKLHDVAFEAFYPTEYASKLPHEMILHKFDDKLDFRPHMLYIGSQSMNMKDAHDNGRFDGVKSARMSCVSYINGVLEKRHESQKDAVDYLRANGHQTASQSHISQALNSDDVLTKYDRTWKIVVV
jgi:hypothetical protein